MSAPQRTLAAIVASARQHLEQIGVVKYALRDAVLAGSRRDIHVDGVGSVHGLHLHDGHGHFDADAGVVVVAAAAAGDDDLRPLRTAGQRAAVAARQARRDPRLRDVVKALAYDWHAVPVTGAEFPAIAARRRLCRGLA